MARPWSMLGIPVDSVSAPPGGPAFGTELSPAALRERGLVEALGAGDAGDVDVRIVGPDRDPATGLVGGSTVAETVTGVREATAGVLAAGTRPFLLGGCCTILIGAFPAAYDAHGPIGLVYLDGHLDLYDHETSPTGEAADMPVAALFGVGVPGLADRAVLDGGRLRVLGARDPDELADERIIGLARKLGVVAVSPQEIAADAMGVANEALVAVAGSGFWMHLDVDVLDEVAFPATDYLMPDGLDLDTLARVMAPLGRDERLIGFSLGCYNPEKDPGGRYGDALIALLTDVFA